MNSTFCLEYRGFEEKEYNVNGNRGTSRHAVFMDSDSLVVIKCAIKEDYLSTFLGLNLEQRKTYTVVCDMTCQPQVTNDRETYGRDRFVISQKNFLCSFVVKEIIPFDTKPVNSGSPSESPDKKVTK